MDELRIRALPADIVGLPDWAGRALATRPRPEPLPGMIVPASIAEVPRPVPEPDDEHRDRLVSRLEASLGPLGPHVAVLDSVRALARPGACLVVAGQQPGLLGGPLYNLHKAVHAIRLARELEQAWGVPVRPAFWNHADDHDIAEVHHVWLRNRNLDLFKVPLAGASSGRRPLSTVRFSLEGSRLGALREVLLQNLAPTDEVGALVDRFLPRDGESFARAFTRVLLELFGADGLIVIEPDWIREDLSRALVELATGDLLLHLEEGSAALRSAGREPAIEPSTAALLFHHEEGKRRALRAGDARPTSFRLDGEPGSRTASELAAEILEEPAAWSPGALLRPLCQDRALPVACYVGGWGELAYHAQLPPLRRAAGLPQGVFVPRLSVTLVDEPTRRSLETLGLEVADVLRARGQVAGPGDEASESEVAARLRAIAAEARRALLAERDRLAELDRGLGVQLKKVADQAVQPVEKLAGKVDRVNANQKGRGRRHTRRLETSLFPRGLPQERVLSLLQTIAQHGTDWIAFLREAIDPIPTEHFVLHFPRTGESP